MMINLVVLETNKHLVQLLVFISLSGDLEGCFLLHVRQHWNIVFYIDLSIFILVADEENLLQQVLRLGHSVKNSITVGEHNIEHLLKKAFIQVFHVDLLILNLLNCSPKNEIE